MVQNYESWWIFMKPNGPAVWFVATASRRKWFLLFLLDEQEVSRQDLIV